MRPAATSLACARVAETPHLHSEGLHNFPFHHRIATVMRLIDTRTIELTWFRDNEIPKYAILSHVWGPDEVSYQEFIWLSRAKSLSASQTHDAMSSSQTSLFSQNEESNLILAAIEVMVRGTSGRPLGSLTESDMMARRGYSKIFHAAEQARDLGCGYLWVDTCCIDKSSSAELQEAINSMYRWYSHAEVCLVYLEDIAKPMHGSYTTASEIAQQAFETCRWGKRGW